MNNDKKICKYCLHRGSAAEDDWCGNAIAYFCKLYKFEYEICDVGVVSPEYVCDSFVYVKRLNC